MSSHANTHVDPIELIEYARGGLSRSAARDVRDHCTTCAACGDQLAAIVLLRERAEVTPVTPRWRPVAAAAAAILVLGLGWLVLGGLPGANEAGTSAGTVEVDGTADGSASPPTKLPEIPWSPRQDSVFSLAAAAYLGTPVATATVSEGILDSSSDDAIRRSLAADRRTVAADLAADSSVDPRLAGLALYLDGRVEAARGRLAPVVSPPAPATFVDEAPLDRFATIALAGALAELGDKSALAALLAHWTPAERVDHMEAGLDRLREFAAE